MGTKMKMGRILEQARWRKLLHMACAVLLVFLSGCETPLIDDVESLFGDKPTVRGTVENTDAILDNKNKTVVAGLPRKRERVVGKPEPIEPLKRMEPPEPIFDQQAKERMEREAPEVVPEAKIKEVAIEFMGIAGIKTRSNLLMVSFPGRVFFDTASSKIRREGTAVIERFFSLVQITAPKAAITVVGHTDSRGTDAYNISLARRRGASAMKALVIYGVDGGRIQLVAAGERQRLGVGDETARATPEASSAPERDDGTVEQSEGSQSGSGRVQGVDGEASPPGGSRREDADGPNFDGGERPRPVSPTGGAGDDGGTDGGRDREGGTSDGPSRSQFISYVAVVADEDGSDPDGLEHSARMELEGAAIEFILAREPAWRRTPPNNPGFDLYRGDTMQAATQWCEIKAMTGTLEDRPVGISRVQFDWARDHGDGYWIYVVERAGTSNARVVRIQDPAGKAMTFTFDHGWRAVASAQAMDEEGG